MTCTQPAIKLAILGACLASPVACGGTDGSGTSGTTTDGGTSDGGTSDGGTGGVDCATLDLDTCASTAACAVMVAGMLEWPDTGGTACFTVGPNEAVGCETAGLDCGAVNVYATASSTDACYLFPSVCVPDGWIDCKPDPETIGECP